MPTKSPTVKTIKTEMACDHDSNTTIRSYVVDGGTLTIKGHNLVRPTVVLKRGIVFVSGNVAVSPRIESYGGSIITMRESTPDVEMYGGTLTAKNNSSPRVEMRGDKGTIPRAWFYDNSSGLVENRHGQVLCMGYSRPIVTVRHRPHSDSEVSCREYSAPTVYIYRGHVQLSNNSRPNIYMFGMNTGAEVSIALAANWRGAVSLPGEGAVIHYWGGGAYDVGTQERYEAGSLTDTRLSERFKALRFIDHTKGQSMDVPTNAIGRRLRRSDNVSQTAN